MKKEIEITDRSRLSEWWHRGTTRLGMIWFILFCLLIIVSILGI
jgi:hypothetical protein